MIELIKNIGLGLFVNSSYAIMGGDFSLKNYYVMAGSILIMGVCIYAERGEQ